MVFFWKSQIFGKSLKTFGFRIFFLEIFKSTGWYGFPYGFWLFWMCFINFLFKFNINLKFYKRCFIKDDLQKHFFIIGWCLVRKEIHRKKFIAYKETHDCDSSAEKVPRLLPKLSLLLPSLDMLFINSMRIIEISRKFANWRTEKCARPFQVYFNP